MSVAKSEIITVTKESAARCQLDTAILLWFMESDPISIHGLAAAANELYRTMARYAGKTTYLEDYIKEHPELRKASMRVQNFIKHGWRDIRETVRHSIRATEIVILDSIMSHQAIFGSKTHLMTLFAARYRLENPHVRIDGIKPPTLEGFQVDQFADRSRLDFFKIGVERLKGF